MGIEIVTIPCLEDNYTFLIHDDTTGTTALVDAPEAAPILEALNTRGWGLDMVLLTHHHWDHVDGLGALQEKYAPTIVGAAVDAERLPKLDLAVAEGDTFQIGSTYAHVLDVSGHTVGHIAFHIPDADAVFTADSLMALGCGRVFEGTFAQMWTSLQKLMALPADSIVYSGHEYTAANGKFALSVEPNNADLVARVADVTAARAKGLPTVPSPLALELATNPFLRGDSPEIQANMGMVGADAGDVFARVRAAKDNF